jgi:hypothetical protein
MSSATGDSPVSEALALRALAHPVRWKLIDVLTSEGTVTATRCSELIGESTATCSYHLGVLAKYGYITRVAGSQWREKPWRLVKPDIHVSSASGNVEQASAARAVAESLLDYELARLKESIRQAGQEPAEWQGTHKIMGATPWLTAAELRQAIAEIGQVIDKYSGRGQAAAERPADARPARLFAAAAPMPPDLASDD